MYKFYALIISFVTFQQVKCNPKLHVEVFYESLCPDSYNFITDQLHPVFRELAPYIHLKLIPFGKSLSLQEKDGVEFICQHGPNECRGNRIQSCALANISNPIQQVDYVNCFMKSFTTQHLQGQKCAEHVGLDLDEIADCYSSSVGTNYQLEAERRTAAITPKFVPTIVYNQQFNQQLQDESLVDFRRVVCNLITQTYPEACKSPSIIRL